MINEKNFTILLESFREEKQFEFQDVAETYRLNLKNSSTHKQVQYKYNAGSSSQGKGELGNKKSKKQAGKDSSKIMFSSRGQKQSQISKNSNGNSSSSTKIQVEKSSRLTASKRRNLRNSHLKMKSSSFNFNLNMLSCSIFLILILMAVVQTIYSYSYYPKTRMISTYIKAYLLGIESWNSYVRMISCLYSSISWNNTATFWDMSTFEAYKVHNQYIRQNILANLTLILKEDFGELQENYTKIFLQVSILLHSTFHLLLAPLLTPRVTPVRRFWATKNTTIAIST